MLSVKTENGFKPVSILASTAGLAEKYNPASSYSVGDYCTYNMALYKCTASTTGTWDSTKWTQVYVTDELETAVSSHADRRDNPHVVTTAQIGAVPDDRTVQGHALSSNVTLWKDKEYTLDLWTELSAGNYVSSIFFINADIPISPIADLDLSSVAFEDVETYEEAWSLVYRVCVQTNGVNATLHFYAKDNPSAIVQSLPVKVRYSL